MLNFKNLTVENNKCISTPTQEIFNKVIKEYNKVAHQKSRLKENTWEQYKANTCLYIQDGCLYYGGKTYAFEKHYEIILPKFNEIKKSNRKR